ncbi:Rieske 2Fe-2S domain-containing protein [Rhizobium tropici]|uniref:Rieske domain-containing protein n=1 Tax=Rhizobium tropici TaxID=398 RepID=A0A329YJD6_RHITR|nr:Rieske 2Fe-2S domain-containing protein [Rhizobium tropici]RAX42424.1 hypothetical protein DQ393_06165 [Rhizobium tropici]
MTPRLDQLAAPVEIGKFYLVPTVEAEWYGRVQPWPVIGPKHSDAHCLRFEEQHYHPDPRFIAARRRDDDYNFWRFVAAAPITTNKRINSAGLPRPVWRRRKCLRPANPWLQDIFELVQLNGNWQCHFAEWTGKQAKHDGRGWVCPHRAVPLADHAPVAGVITCPLHMLRIDADTGVVLPPLEGIAA